MRSIELQSNTDIQGIIGRSLQVVEVVHGFSVSPSEFLASPADISRYVNSNRAQISVAVAEFARTHATIQYLDESATVIAVDDHHIPAHQPVIILRNTHDGVTVTIDPIGLHNFSNEVQYPNLKNWSVRELLRNREHVQAAAERHGIPEHALICGVIIENLSIINRLPQDAMLTNVLQDSVAMLLNTSQAANSLLRAMLVYAAYEFFNNRDFSKKHISRRDMLKLLAGVSLGMGTQLTAVITEGFTGPTAASNYTLPPLLEKQLQQHFEIFARRENVQTTVERSVGLAALKPYEMYDLLFNSSQIPIANPHTGNPYTPQLPELPGIGEEELAQQFGFVFELWLSYLGSSTPWSLEFGAARIQLAQAAYPEYRNKFNSDWEQQLPEFEELEYDDRMSYLVWAATIAKGKPLELLDSEGRTTNFGWKYAKRNISKIHPQGTTQILCCWKLLEQLTQSPV